MGGRANARDRPDAKSTPSRVQAKTNRACLVLQRQFSGPLVEVPGSRVARASCVQRGPGC